MEFGYLTVDFLQCLLLTGIETGGPPLYQRNGLQQTERFDHHAALIAPHEEIDQKQQYRRGDGQKHAHEETDPIHGRIEHD